jgi:NAD(P)-dependent dehydrogenase (short-subunit alcohol dehydrogenase family)
MTKPLTSKIALITGASRGIGRATALALAEAGAHVICLARTTGALEELDDEITAKGGSATLVPCDLKDFDALDRLGANIYERWGKLDIFVANAGILGPISPLAHVDIKNFDMVMATNVTANWRLIRSLDALLTASDAGRAIFISSSAAHSAKAYWGAYATSKAALETLARTYADEVSNISNTKVMIVNPGPLRTKMRQAAMPGEDPNTLRTPEDLAPHILRLASPDWIETGKLYDFPTNSVLSFRNPA